MLTTWHESERHLSQTTARALQLERAGRPQGAVLEVVEHEQADRRRQIALLAGSVDLANQLGQRHAACRRNLLHAVPERRLETDARLVAADHDRPLHDGGFVHCATPTAWTSSSSIDSRR